MKATEPFDTHACSIIAAATALAPETVRRWSRGKRVQASTARAIENALANLAEDARQSIDRALAARAGGAS